VLTRLGGFRGEASLITWAWKVAHNHLSTARSRNAELPEVSLDREQRLVYVLDTIFDLSSREAAEVVGITAEAHRQGLTRTRAWLNGFTGKTCGLTSPELVRQAAARVEARYARRPARARIVGNDGTSAFHPPGVDEFPAYVQRPRG
jgi:hypothetical protein